MTAKGRRITELQTISGVFDSKLGGSNFKNEPLACWGRGKKVDTLWPTPREINIINAPQHSLTQLVYQQPGEGDRVYTQQIWWLYKTGEVAQLKVMLRFSRTLIKLESWVERHLMKFNKGKCRVLYVRRNNPKCQQLCRREQFCRKGNQQEKDLGAALQKRTWESWRIAGWLWPGSALMARRAKDILGCIGKSVANRCYDSMNVEVLWPN